MRRPPLRHRAASKLFQTLALIMFIFAAVGMQLFGGKITTDVSGMVVTRAQAEALAASPFGESGYLPNSFNDMPSGMVTLFELLVVNNWHVISSGYEAVLGVHARWFFILFYCVGVVMGLNICVAFVLDTYNSIAAQDGLEEFIAFDAARVTGTRTGLVGEFEVSLHYVPLLPSDERLTQLHRLFEASRKKDDSEQARRQRAGQAQAAGEQHLGRHGAQINHLADRAGLKELRL